LTLPRFQGNLKDYVGPYHKALAFTSAWKQRFVLGSSKSYGLWMPSRIRFL